MLNKDTDMKSKAAMLLERQNKISLRESNSVEYDEEGIFLDVDHFVYETLDIYSSNITELTKAVRNHTTSNRRTALKKILGELVDLLVETKNIVEQVKVELR